MFVRSGTEMMSPTPRKPGYREARDSLLKDEQSSSTSEIGAAKRRNLLSAAN